jgi:DNA adenine methylase
VTKSVIRWAGSKKKLLPKLEELWVRASASGRYIEPFAGSAAFFFSISPPKAVLSDSNPELIHALGQLKTRCNKVFEEVASYPVSESFYYKLRAQDPSDLSSISRAARFFYLNRFCFNGIYRTNRSGQFNVPFGAERAGALPEREYWLKCSEVLKGAVLYCEDFESVAKREARKGDFIYIDPPYAVSNRRIFRQYTKSEFGLEDIERLAALLQVLDARGVKFVVSYAQSPETEMLSRGWRSTRTVAQRNVAGFSHFRRKAQEVMITNF